MACAKFHAWNWISKHEQALFWPLRALTLRRDTCGQMLMPEYSPNCEKLEKEVSITQKLLCEVRTILSVLAGVLLRN